MEKRAFRTDLAFEACTEQMRQNSQDGISYRTWDEGTVELFEVCVTSEQAAKALGKEVGRYRTLSVGRVWEDAEEVFGKKVETFASSLRSFLPDLEGGVLVVGLGNRHITADSVGPQALEHVLVTRHLKEGDPSLYALLGSPSTAAITPGVLGETGVESADVIASLVEKIHPSCVICVDALASGSLSRLATTVQISSAGITPGSGVGNRRETLNEQTLGVPVLSVGVPTVVDALTLALELLGEGQEAVLDNLEEDLRTWGMQFFVTPKESDEIMRTVSALIGFGINLALHPFLTQEEMRTLVG